MSVHHHWRCCCCRRTEYRRVSFRHRHHMLLVLRFRFIVVVVIFLSLTDAAAAADHFNSTRASSRYCCRLYLSYISHFIHIIHIYLFYICRTQHTHPASKWVFGCQKRWKPRFRCCRCRWYLTTVPITATICSISVLAMDVRSLYSSSSSSST